MTTYEQELTLFGGWAKALIPPPIGVGVMELLGSVSVSVSSEVLEGFYYDEDRSWNKNQTDIAYMFNEYNVKPHVESYGIGILNGEEYVNDEYHIPQVIVKYYLDLAFLRFFEVWRKGSAEVYRRGLSGTGKLKRSFSGKVGAQSIGHRGKAVPIVRVKDKYWGLNDGTMLYPRIRHLSPSGIQNIQSLARKLRDQRQIYRKTL